MTRREFMDGVPVKAVLPKIDPERFRATGRRVDAAPVSGQGASFAGGFGGGQYRQARAGKKKSVCGIAVRADKTLCGFPRMDEDGTPALEVTSDVWLATRDNMPDDYRPCADCCAEFKNLPAPSRTKIVWDDVRQADGTTVPVMRKVRTTDGLTQRLPEQMDRHGQTPRDAERLESVRARLGRVVPLLLADDGGKIAAESLWTAGAQTVHAGARRDGTGRVFLACRDEPVDSDTAKRPDAEKAPSLTCGTCRGLLYRSGSLSVAMMAVILRPVDADRFRPVSGVGALSAALIDGEGQFARDEHAGLARDERSRGSAMMPGSAAMDMPKLSTRISAMESGGRKVALSGWAQEAMAGVVRAPGGMLWCPNGAGCAHSPAGFHDGWEFFRATGKLPDAIFRRMSREEKTAVRRGLGKVRTTQRAARERAAERDRKGAAAVSVARYRNARRNGAEHEVSRSGDGLGTYADGIGRIDIKPMALKVALAK